MTFRNILHGWQGKQVSSFGSFRKNRKADNPSVVTQGLILHLDPGNPLSYTGTGTTWTDLSGNGNNSTLTNGPTFSPVNNGILTFDGVNDFAQTSLFDADNSKTFSTWFYPTSAAANNSTALMRGRDNSGVGWNLRIGFNSATGDRYRASAVIGVTAYDAFATGASLNTWVHLTGVYIAGTSINLYVNGILSATTATPVGALRISTAGWVSASSSASNFNAQSNGQVLVYDRVLSSSEIMQNFQATRARYGV